MSSKWKTTQRKVIRRNPESSGNLSSCAQSVTSEGSSGSLAFLHQMMDPMSQQNQANSNNNHEPAPRSCEIEDILDIESGADSHRNSTSSSFTGLSGLSGNLEKIKDRRSSARSDVSGEPQSPPAQRLPNRKLPTLSRNTSFKETFKTGVHERINSREDMIETTSNDYSPYKNYVEPLNTDVGISSPEARQRKSPSLARSKGSRDSLSRSKGSRDSFVASRDRGSKVDIPSRGPSIEQPPSNHRSSDLGISSHTVKGHNSKLEDNAAPERYDNITPIPVFSVNTEHDDDISQITTSVTSYYDVDHSSRTSSSLQWSRGMRSSQRGSHGEVSYADTLDEIADMLGPNRNQARECSRSMARSPSDDDFLRRDKNATPVTTNSTPLFASIKYDAPALSADEIYRNSKSPFESLRRRAALAMAKVEPFLSQIRLLIRYWISIIFPNEWRRGGRSKKDDGSWHSTKLKITRTMRRQRWFNSGGAILALFFSLTIFVLLLRLIFLHGSTAVSSNQIRGTADTSAAVHGGMSARESDAKVIGHMANHDADNGESKKAKKHDVSAKEKIIHDEHVGSSIPEEFDNLADVMDLPINKNEIPFFWHIPRSAGGTVNDIFGRCFGLTLASDAGAAAEASEELKVIKASNQFNYLNVDMSNKEGIERAKKLELANSGLADMAISTLLFEASSMFTSEHKGRMFTVMRHPVERAASLFHYVQDTQWRRSNKKELANLGMEDYFKSGLAENNWMTRFLINEPKKGELTREDANKAKEILRRKCLIGLLNQKGETFDRIERYFGISQKGEEQKECHEKKLQWAWPLKHRHEEVEEDSSLWDLIMSENKYDMELYRYASEVLFEEQGMMLKEAL
mmetsp:Transcript_24253/g.36651  ORF Transcript_24253/g.36651 Transcript_24253/m.36651 type:complete len:858 (+) Transcript_24253:194-2767(+)